MIEFRNVSKIYPNGAKALEDVSFEIQPGEFIFCIGESGAGKSTLIRLLTCEEKPTSGTVILGHYELSRLQKRLIPRIRRKIGMIFQDFRLIETKTVYENVAFAMEIVGASKREIKRRVPMVLSVVGLKDKADSYPNELSGGEAQRVGVARAMINNPRLILADEPTGNLDPANGEAILALLEEINRAGTTVICCTHDVDLVNLMKKRVIEIEKGHLIRDEVEASYEKCSLTEHELHVSRTDEQEEELNEELLKNIYLEKQERLEKRKRKTEKIKERINQDSRRRRNRLSLAERIAKMRMLADVDQESPALREISKMRVEEQKQNQKKEERSHEE